MSINELLIQKNITKYRLCKESGVPQATISDICSGKTSIEKCSAETIFRIARVLNVSMESLIAPAVQRADEDRRRPSFELFKSNICHRVKDLGDIPFIMGYNMFIAILTIAGILLADVMYAVVDPRVKLGR